MDAIDRGVERIFECIFECASRGMGAGTQQSWIGTPRISRVVGSTRWNRCGVLQLGSIGPWRFDRSAVPWIARTRRSGDLRVWRCRFCRAYLSCIDHRADRQRGYRPACGRAGHRSVRRHEHSWYGRRYRFQSRAARDDIRNSRLRAADRARRLAPGILARQVTSGFCVVCR